MPDVHLGKDRAIGSVIPTKGAIIPAAVGVDIGCGDGTRCVPATAADLPENLAELRSARGLCLTGHVPPDAGVAMWAHGETRPPTLMKNGRSWKRDIGG